MFKWPVSGTNNRHCFITPGILDLKHIWISQGTWFIHHSPRQTCSGLSTQSGSCLEVLLLPGSVTFSTPRQGLSASLVRSQDKMNSAKVGSHGCTLRRAGWARAHFGRASSPEARGCEGPQRLLVFLDPFPKTVSHRMGASKRRCSRKTRTWER